MGLPTSLSWNEVHWISLDEVMVSDLLTCNAHAMTIRGSTQVRDEQPGHLDPLIAAKGV
jgi:hypothetical protein